MPVLQKGVAALANQMPKVISPKAHAIADYATIGTFGLLAGLFWGRSKRAAIAALVCAGAANLLLQAMKEELFQLELDRQQGKISQEEYEQSKAALDLTLKRALSRQASAAKP